MDTILHFLNGFIQGSLDSSMELSLLLILLLTSTITIFVLIRSEFEGIHLILKSIIFKNDYSKVYESILSFFNTTSEMTFLNRVFRKAIFIYISPFLFSYKAYEQFLSKNIFLKNSFSIFNETIKFTLMISQLVEKTIPLQRDLKRNCLPEDNTNLKENTTPEENTIIGLIACDKADKYLKGHLISLLAIISYFCIALIQSIFSTTTFSYTFFSSSVFIIFLLFNILLLVKKYTLLFRLSCGLYGTNEYEAREIITYIIKHNPNNDNDKFKNMKVFNTDEEKSFSLSLRKAQTSESEVRV